MSYFKNFTKKQKLAEKKMQKLLFGQPLYKAKRCTKKNQKAERNLLQIIS